MNTTRFSHRDRRNNSRKAAFAVEAMEDRKLMTAGFVVGAGSYVVEGTGANTTMNFVVKLALPSTSTVKVNYVTADVTAKAGEDYIATSGTITFEPGQTVQVVPVTIIGDSAPELTQTLNLRLSDGGNARVLTPALGGIILDDDVVATSGLSISDTMMARGLSGVRTMNFTVRLNSAQSTPVTVTASTANGTALAGVDYQAKTELLTFAPGETTKTFSVNIFGAAGFDEKIFTVKLGGATVGLARSYATGILRFGA